MMQAGGSKEAWSSKNTSMLYELEVQQRHAAEHVVPWFLDNMPDQYFAEVPKDLQKIHLRALAGINQSLESIQMPELTLAHGNTITLMLPEHSTSRNLADILDRFRRSGLNTANNVIQGKLTSVQMFTSSDGALNLKIFAFNEPHQDLDNKISNYGFTFEEADSLFDEVKGTEGTVVHVRMDPTIRNRGIIFMAASNVMKTLAFMRVSQCLSMHGISLKNAVLSSQKDSTNTLGTRDEPGDITAIKLEVEVDAIGFVPWSGCPGRPGFSGSKNKSRRGSLKMLDQEEQELLAVELQHSIKWSNDSDFDLAMRQRFISLTQAEIIQALASLQQTRLGLNDPYTFTASNISQMIEQPVMLPHVVQIANLFLERFDPSGPLGNDTFRMRCHALEADLRRSMTHEKEFMLLNGMLDAVRATRRTNVYLPKRYALAFRLDPEHLGHGTVGTDMPFGALFVYGRRFKGFHVRFRDIARGGLRVVAPRTKEQYAVESTRIYNEAYSLAYAQQLKNKDIPEGGAKAAILLAPDISDQYVPELYGQSFMIRKCVRAFVESILDLTIGNPLVVDYLGREEFIYLGPDENIIPQDIEWIINRAVQRDYVMPQALMSSKPKNGINHKQYGVTSEGVAVYLEVALMQTGGHPRQTGRPFSVKLTGGTDGDVAGNMLRILHRDYGAECIVVGLADGTACLEDPDGLDWPELLRMVCESLPLSEYMPAKLGPNGVLAKTDTVEGCQLRDTMHNRVKADSFVPAGGRPATINIRNYREFLSGPSSEASSQLIVEGANLFITPEARQALFEEAGVLIVKDSSANKCGVVTSSYEILASMLATPEEFLLMKAALVPDVLKQLKRLARMEAEMLFREHNTDPATALPKQSEKSSRAMMQVHDAVTAALQCWVMMTPDGKPSWDQPLVTESETVTDLTLGEVLNVVAGEHVPKALLDHVGVESLRERLPWSYLQNLIACILATKLVYGEGIEHIEKLVAQDNDKIAIAAFRYLQSTVDHSSTPSIQTASAV
jgi:glutamate dehydrogenase